MSVRLLHPDFVQMALADRRKRRDEKPSKPDLLKRLASFSPRPEASLYQAAADYFFFVLGEMSAAPRRALRAALALMLTFLRHNDLRLSVRELDLFRVCVDAQQDELSAEDLADFLKAHCLSKTLSEQERHAS